ncbi:hypothetical protein [Ruania albidiflava]|uniref:hypothetical protein n=1 Tax=Ruania albidiflava TaxID=366586 RepID=UPI0003B529A1|nr:hypothetical protein [Ruania albidiflava]
MTAADPETVCTTRRLQIGTDQAGDAWTTPGGLQAWWWSDEPADRGTHAGVPVLVEHGAGRTR